MIAKSKYYNGPALAANIAIKKGTLITAYGGRKWRIGDPNIPSDNTHQTIIPGSDFMLDAGGPIKPIHGKAHEGNECWNPAEANFRIVSHGIDYL